MEIRGSGPLLTGSVAFAGTSGPAFAAPLPLVKTLHTQFVCSQVASNSIYHTAVAVVNPGTPAVTAHIEVLDGSGRLVTSGDSSVPAKGRISRLLTQFSPEFIGQNIGARYIVCPPTGPSPALLRSAPLI